MMTQVLPATVEELNMQQNFRVSSTLNVNVMLKKSAFEDIPTEKKLKREVSLPNGVENWNISNFDSYLNFDDAIGNEFDVCASPDDRTVPEGDPRDRCVSVSSVSSFAEEKRPTFHNFGVKTFSTVHMDSGSTLRISSDHSYFNSNSAQKGLDPEETYQNLDLFLQEVPELKTTETLAPAFSPLPSSSSEEIFELTTFENSRSLSSEDSFESNSQCSKRPLENIAEDEVFVSKQTKHEPSETFGTHRYHEIRRKNNLASKNCRKTRKEKQKEMEQKVIELEQEKEHLKEQALVLEKLIQAHKQCLMNAIAQKR